MTRSRNAVLAIASLLYFSEGFPYGLVTELAPIYLRVQHVSLTEIGFLNTVAFAWTAKFFWSPLIEFAPYRRWIAGALATMTLLLGTLAAVPARGGAIFWTILTLVTIASATQDIAADALTIRITPTPLLGPVNSLRVAAYRAALMLGGGGLAALGGYLGWRAAFGAAATTTAILFVAVLMIRDERDDAPRAPRAIWRTWRWHWTPAVIAVVMLYRFGELAIVPMTKPFWVDRGYSPAEIATITTVVGVVVSILGALAGGAFLARFGLYRGLIWLGVAQVASNIGYAVAAMISAGRPGIWTAAVLENLGYGLGTAAFLAFLMAICDPEHAATEYAFLTALFGLARLPTSYSGYVADHVGYTAYFWITVLLGVPALLLLPLIRDRLPRHES